MKEKNNTSRPPLKERVLSSVRPLGQKSDASETSKSDVMKQFASSLWQKVRYFDLWLLVPFVVLLFFGALMVYSASVWWGIVQYDYEPNHFYIRQMIFATLGFVIFMVTVFVKKELYTSPVPVAVFAGITILMLIYVRLMGWGDGAGARSWFSLFGINVQPAEVAKLAIIVVMTVMLTHFLKRRHADELLTKHYALLFAYPLLCIVLVASQPDLGAVAVMLSLVMGIFIVTGVSARRYMRMLGGVVLAAGAAALIGVLTGYISGNRLGRLKAWLDPFEYQTIEGYQVIQGYVAIGSGGLGGVGLGHSAQKLGYLPEPHTDFIMAVISEELGFIGVLIVVGLLYTIVCRALIIALKTPDLHMRFLAAGIGTWIGIQTFVNLGGMLGFIPLTGVTLPFVSYGGTSMVLLSLSMGILMNISIHEKVRQRKQRKPETAA